MKIVIYFRNWGNLTFQRYSDLFRDIGGSTGIQKLSGYILSEDIEKLNLQAGFDFSICCEISVIL